MVQAPDCKVTTLRLDGNASIGVEGVKAVAECLKVRCAACSKLLLAWCADVYVFPVSALHAGQAPPGWVRAGASLRPRFGGGPHGQLSHAALSSVCLPQHVTLCLRAGVTEPPLQADSAGSE